MVKGFTDKVRELLKNEGPKTNKEIINIYGHLTSSPGPMLRRSKGFNYLGAAKLGVYYLNNQEEGAKKRLGELRLESKRRRKEYYRKLILPHNPDIRTSLDIFRSDNDEYTLREIWGMMGGYYKKVHNGLKALEKAGVLLVVKGRPKKYRRNPQYAKICNGAYEEAQKEIFGK